MYMSVLWSSETLEMKWIFTYGSGKQIMVVPEHDGQRVRPGCRTGPEGASLSEQSRAVLSRARKHCFHDRKEGRESLLPVCMCMHAWTPPGLSALRAGMGALLVEQKTKQINMDSIPHSYWHIFIKLFVGKNKSLNYMNVYIYTSMHIHMRFVYAHIIDMHMCLESVYTCVHIYMYYKYVYIYYKYIFFFFKPKCPPTYPGL